MSQWGDYRLLDQLGGGATGPVWAARRVPALSGHDLFAVKVLYPEVARNERFVVLLREGVARFGEFEHPGAVRVFEVVGSGESLLVASELVDGQPLDHVVNMWTQQQTRGDPTLALWIVHRLAATLLAAHASGMVHGHLSSSQVMVTYDGEIRLLGIGLGAARGAVSLTGARRAFLAPEVVRTGVVSPASDVHSLARILHHAVSGAGTMSSRGVEAPSWLPPLKSYGVSIHPAVEVMVEGMLAASPRARPPMEEVDSALASAVMSRGPNLRNHLAGLMKTGFTAEQAAARLRRERANRGADDIASRDENFVLRLESRTIKVNRTGQFTLPADVQLEFRNAAEAAAKERNAKPSRLPPPLTVTESSALVHQWTERSPNGLQGGGTFDDIFRYSVERGERVDVVDPRRTTGPIDPSSRAGTGSGVDRASRANSRADTRADSRSDDVARAGAGLGRDRDRNRVDRVHRGDHVDWSNRTDRVDRDEWSNRPERLDRQDHEERPTSALRALESGDDDEIDALVNQIVKASSSTPPAGVDPGSSKVPQAGIESIPAALPAEDPILERVLEEAIEHEPTDVATRPEPLVESNELVYGMSVEDDTSPVPAALPPEAVFTDEVPRLPAGTMIGERYRIVDVIGEGGVSVVYKGLQVLLGREVAIKVLRPELATMPPVVERFHREARSVAQLDHPNIVRVIDFGRSHAGSLFLVMDLIEGVSLADQLDREGWLAPTSAVRIVVGILTGLEHAHGRGVVHRDLKPDNIMIIGSEQSPAEVKILDFGIAKLGDVEIGNRPITEAGMVFGTPRYMSPEQAAGEKVDHRSDLFTVGIILYQLLSGQLPFDGETTLQILRRVLTQPAPRLRVHGLPSATSEAVADVVARALAKNPEERFPSARIMRESLQSCFPL